MNAMRNPVCTPLQCIEDIIHKYIKLLGREREREREREGGREEGREGELPSRLLSVCVVTTVRYDYVWSC